MTGVRLTKRGFLVNMVLFFSYFSWYAVFSLYVLQYVVSSSTETYAMVNVSFNFIIAVTLLLASFFIHKLNKIRIIYVCSLTTSLLSILLLFTSGIVFRSIIIFLTGVFFSIGQLGFFTFFWDLTVSEERGRVAGLIGFFSLPLNYVVVWMAETCDFSGAIMLSVILSLEPLITKLLNPKKRTILTTKGDEKGINPEKRTIFLYSVPWALFSLINTTLARNISLNISHSVPISFYMVLIVLQLVAAGFGALGGGIIADFFGRKSSLIFSLTLYGISCALVGVINNYELLHFVYFANGLNWGILLVMYTFVVWGDLANKESYAKRYSIGLIIYYLTMSIGSLLAYQISLILLIVSSLFSCLLIFFSNISLLLAPELLSTDFRERIKMKVYMNVVKKIRPRQPRNQG